MTAHRSVVQALYVNSWCRRLSAAHISTAATQLNHSKNRANMADLILPIIFKIDLISTGNWKDLDSRRRGRQRMDGWNLCEATCMKINESNEIIMKYSTEKTGKNMLIVSSGVDAVLMEHDDDFEIYKNM